MSGAVSLRRQILLSLGIMVAGVILLSIVGSYAFYACLLYTSPSPRDKRQSRMPSSA